MGCTGWMSRGTAIWLFGAVAMGEAPAWAQAPAWPSETYQALSDDRMQGAPVDLNSCVDFSDGAPRLGGWPGPAPVPTALRSRLHGGDNASIRRKSWSALKTVKRKSPLDSLIDAPSTFVAVQIVHDLQVASEWRPLFYINLPSKSAQYSLACKIQDDAKSIEVPDHYQIIVANTNSQRQAGVLFDVIAGKDGKSLYLYDGEIALPADYFSQKRTYGNLTERARERANGTTIPALKGYSEEIKLQIQPDKLNAVILYKPAAEVEEKPRGNQGGRSPDGQDQPEDGASKKKDPETSLAGNFSQCLRDIDDLRTALETIRSDFASAQQRLGDLNGENQRLRSSQQAMEEEARRNRSTLSACEAEKRDLGAARDATVRVRLPDALTRVDLTQVLLIAGNDGKACAPVRRLRDGVSYEADCRASSAPAWTLTIRNHAGSTVPLGGQTAVLHERDLKLDVRYRIGLAPDQIQGAVSLQALHDGIPVDQHRTAGGAAGAVPPNCQTTLRWPADPADQTRIVRGEPLDLPAACASIDLPYTGAELAAIGAQPNCLNRLQDADKACIVPVGRAVSVRLPGSRPGTVTSYPITSPVVTARIDAHRAQSEAPVWPYARTTPPLSAAGVEIDYCLSEDCTRRCQSTPLRRAIADVQADGLPTFRDAGCAGDRARGMRIRFTTLNGHPEEIWPLQQLALSIGDQPLPVAARRVAEGPAECRSRGYSTVVVVGDSEKFRESGAAGSIASAIGRWARAERSPYRLLFQGNDGHMEASLSASALAGKDAGEVERALFRAVSERAFSGGDRRSLAALPNIERIALRDEAGMRTGCTTVVFFTDGIGEDFAPMNVDIVTGWRSAGIDLWVVGLRACHDWAQRGNLEGRCLQLTPSRQPGNAGTDAAQILDFLNKVTR